MEVAHCQIVVADVTDDGPGRSVDVEAGVLAEFTDAEQVGCVGDDDDVVEIIFARDRSETMDLLFGVDGASLGDDAAEGDSVGEQIVAAYAAFGVAGIFVGAATQGDDERSDLFAVELDGMVEAGVEDGGGVAGVLRRTEDGNGVGGLGVVYTGHGGDLLIHPDAPSGGDQQHDPEQPAEEETARTTSALQVGGGDDHRVKRTRLYGERMLARTDEKKSATGFNYASS